MVGENIKIFDLFFHRWIIPILFLPPTSFIVLNDIIIQY